MGADDQAITAAQHALALATAGGMLLSRRRRTTARPRLLCPGRLSAGDRLRQQTVVALGGERHRERFDRLSAPRAVPCPPGLVPAQLGTFAEGRPSGMKGSGLPRRLTTPGASWAFWGIALLALRQGDLYRALPSSSGPWASVRTRAFGSFFPCWLRTWSQRTLWPGASPTLCRYSRRR